MKNFRKSFLHFAVIVYSVGLLHIINSCNTNDPPPVTENKITLTEIDTGVEETYLSINLDKANKNQTVILKRDGKTIITFSASRTDTIVADTCLYENRSYGYKAIITENSKTVDESYEIIIETLVPENRDITWETYEFGEHNYSRISDVTVLDENNMWAVGEIYLKDSLGQNDGKPYAAANWDGEKWSLWKVSYSDYGNPRPPAYPGPLFAIDALNEKTIYTASFANLLNLNNNSWNEIAFFMVDLSFMGQLKRIRLLNESRIYCVGNSGAIYIVTENGWQQIESRTENTIYDICGYVNPLTNKEEMICGSSDRENPSNNLLIKITDTDNIELIQHPENELIGSAWTNKGFPVYTCGAGVYTNKTGKWKEITFDVNYGSSKIRGRGLNDIFVCGVNGFAAHYNGIKWKILDGFKNIIFTSISVKENIVVMAGYKNNKAVITIGRR